jgi:predicted neuraminidase
MYTRFAFLLLGIVLSLAAQEKPFHESEFIFPLEHWHNHSSSIVELPNGDLLVCWFHGSGERTADDVLIQAARRSRSSKSWSAPFTLADTPGFPDTNPVLFLDSKQRLWFFWPAILANTWESALMKYKVSSDYLNPGLPKWSDSGNILLVPKNIEQRTKEVFAKEFGTDARGRHAERMIERSKDKLSSRLGWFSRTHPLELPSGRILLPMYSDGFSFSLIGISDDGGNTWTASEPIVGYGNIQPSLVRRRDGTLVAYMRDNGPAPKRIHTSVSRDNGMTWTPAVDTDFPNPGASVEAISLRDGSWLIVYNDLESGRHSLAVSLSEDEGRTWKWTRHLELDRQRKSASFHYPSVMQARDGSIHVTYSYFLNHLPADAPRKAIKYARFNAAWVKEGDAKTLIE